MARAVRAVRARAAAEPPSASVTRAPGNRVTGARKLLPPWHGATEAFAVESPPALHQILPVPPASPFRLLSVLMFLAAQAALWLVLALAFAALLVLAGSMPWAEAFGISALNWLPWAVLAPAVFWLSLRCPLLPGRLWRSVPIHAAACGACVFLTLGLALQTGPFGRSRREGDRMDSRDAPPPGMFPRGPVKKGDGKLRREGPMSRDLLPPGAPPDRPPPESRGGPGRGGPRGGFGPDGPPEGFAGHGPFGGMLPPLGSMLLRVNFDLAVYLIVSAAAHALAFYRRAQERDRHALELAAGLNRAKLDALRLQLQPHFLFNTLNAIATLVHRDANAADELIGDLSELLRLSLATTDHEVPLGREIELLDRYLAIEQARLGDRLRVAREIEPATLSAFVPTFVLQPLAENAIRHGLEPRSAPVTITISARRDGDTLRLAVADDGAGLAANQATSRRGIGLANTEARLQALHGAAASLDLHAPVEGGLRVEITLPFRTAPRSETKNGPREN